MSKRKKQADRAMLEMWRPPKDAGEPVGCLATTYTFDAGFFEEECIARFLQIDSLPDREGLAYLLERENRLGPTYAGVLVDHTHAGVDHSLRWDILSVRIPGAKQHAKISLLAWTRHVRIIIASANLTPSGYRSNQEIAGVIDFSPSNAPQRLLKETSDFLSALLGFMPGDADNPAKRRANEFLKQVTQQVSTWKNRAKRSTVMKQSLAFTLPKAKQPAQSALDGAITACQTIGNKPNEIWVASPFFDPEKENKDDAATARLCRNLGRGVKRTIQFFVPAMGDAADQRLAAPKSLVTTAEKYADRISVASLPANDADQNPRSWHAKMVALSAADYNALMIGSSNFTKAGMGIEGRYNAEANLLYLVRRKMHDQDAGALDDCWPEGTWVRDYDAAEWLGPQQEMVDEEQPEMAPPLPAGFVLADYRAGKDAAVVLCLQAAKLPKEWRILGGRNHESQLLDSDDYMSQGNPSQIEVRWSHSHAPGKLLVCWDDQQTFWSLNVQDQAALPLPDELESMTANDMMYILAASDSSSAFRAWTRQLGGIADFDDDLDTAEPIDLDPLKRYNLQETFLRRVRRQARLLAGVRANMERPVWSEQALNWRLQGVIGIERLAERIAASISDTDSNAAEAVLNLTDLFLMLDEVRYQETPASLSQQKFKRRFDSFRRELAKQMDVSVRQSKAHIPSDVLEFWSRVKRSVTQ